MKIAADVKRQMEKIISGIKCQKDFECYKSEFENLTKVRNLKAQDLIECLGENSQSCDFALPFGEGYFCKCPLRAYIAKKLKK